LVLQIDQQVLAMTNCVCLTQNSQSDSLRAGISNTTKF
jgi:hypothetical protein